MIETLYVIHGLNYISYYKGKNYLIRHHPIAPALCNKTHFGNHWFVDGLDHNIRGWDFETRSAKNWALQRCNLLKN